MKKERNQLAGQIAMQNPVSTKEGKYLVGYGMATATYPANRSKATVRLKLFQEGNAVAASLHAGHRHRNIHSNGANNGRCIGLAD